MKIELWSVGKPHELYAKTGKSENLVCYNLGKISTNAFLSYPTLEQDLLEKDVEETRDIKLTLIKITSGDKTFALNKKTGDLYDYDVYKEALTDPNVELTKIGILEKRGKEEEIKLFSEE